MEAQEIPLRPLPGNFGRAPPERRQVRGRMVPNCSRRPIPIEKVSGRGQRSGLFKKLGDPLWEGKMEQKGDETFFRRRPTEADKERLIAASTVGSGTNLPRRACPI